MESKKILFLGPEKSPLLIWLRTQKETVYQYSEPLTDEFIKENDFDFMISYGYRYIIKKSILDLFPLSAINLHISYLPWNRGADPNLWSFVDHTPKGVTIHLLDVGVDTGGILVQEKIDFIHEHETLSSSYNKLQMAIQELFKKNWLQLKNGEIEPIKAVEKGSYHAKQDIDKISKKLCQGWDTPISILINNSINHS